MIEIKTHVSILGNRTIIIFTTNDNPELKDGDILYDGMVVTAKRRVYIGINKNIPDNFVKRVVAHEITHCFQNDSGQGNMVFSKEQVAMFNELFAEPIVNITNKIMEWYKLNNVRKRILLNEANRTMS